MAKDLNNVFDPDGLETDLEIDALLDHRFVSGILEFECQYSNGDTLWHPLSLVKNDDPYLLAKYVLATSQTSSFSSTEFCPSWIIRKTLPHRTHNSELNTHAIILPMNEKPESHTVNCYPVWSSFYDRRRTIYLPTFMPCRFTGSSSLAAALRRVSVG